MIEIGHEFKNSVGPQIEFIIDYMQISNSHFIVEQVPEANEQKNRQKLR